MKRLIYKFESMKGLIDEFEYIKGLIYELEYMKRIYETFKFALCSVILIDR